MTTIDIKTMTSDERKAFVQQAKEIEKQEKEKRLQDLKALDELAAETLPASMEILRQASVALEEAKAKVFKEFEAYLKLKISTLGIKNNQQSHTITVGKESIKLGYRITDGYGENASYGIAMVHRFLESLGKDDNSKRLLGAVMRLLQRNGKGDLDSKKVLELKQIADKDFPGTDFQKGVEIIQAEYKPKLSKWFIEAYYTDGTGIERSIPLSMTSVDLPKDTDLTFLLPKS
ncbi:DUF3164 family protein [Chryseobacterium sp. G0240]|uniref:DUF3164 family protein n=1 Tax=Chryseobacterium sp. G0240 TaxID=2487066 RepID=UPI000F453A66|nr:DUF3164 family protein [Chryseobacterium sp. G0240]ROH98383.1 DUF3164 family protein [Chryseobacterium sp. G0240]